MSAFWLIMGILAGILASALFSGSLRNKCDLADLKLGRLLDTIDEWATVNGLDGSVPQPERFEPTCGVTGKPLSNVAIPLSCHPPITPFNHRPWFKSGLPLPKGSS